MFVQLRHYEYCVLRLDCAANANQRIVQRLWASACRGARLSTFSPSRTVRDTPGKAERGAANVTLSDRVV